MDSLVPIEDRGGPAQPLLLASGLRKHFPVGGGLLGRGRKASARAMFTRCRWPPDSSCG